MNFSLFLRMDFILVALLFIYGMYGIVTSYTRGGKNAHLTKRINILVLLICFCRFEEISTNHSFKALEKKVDALTELLTDNGFSTEDK